MKKTLVLAFAMLISMGAMAQGDYLQTAPDSVYQQPKYGIYQEMTSEQMINNINEINISLKKFSRMQVGGEIAMIAGSGIIIASSFVHIDKSNADKMINAGMVIGGVTALTGYIVKLCSYKHTNKIQIQGSSIVYKF